MERWEADYWGQACWGVKWQGHSSRERGGGWGANHGTNILPTPQLEYTMYPPSICILLPQHVSYINTYLTSTCFLPQHVSMQYLYQHVAIQCILTHYIHTMYSTPVSINTMYLCKIPYLNKNSYDVFKSSIYPYNVSIQQMYLTQQILK